MGILPKPDEAKLGAVRVRKRTGRLGELPSLPVSAFCFVVWIFEKPLSSTIAHKALNTAFQSFGGVRCHLAQRRGTQALAEADTAPCGLRL